MKITQSLHYIFVELKYTLNCVVIYLVVDSFLAGFYTRKHIHIQYFLFNLDNLAFGKNLYSHVVQIGQCPQQLCFCQASQMI